MSKFPKISGILKVKRNIVYVTRYVEIIDATLNYYKQKGINNSYKLFSMDR